jgi:2,4-dienoyl-CoA reductase-like NADH-dependent reductase (Old Yellow Enzyme family)
MTWDSLFIPLDIGGKIRLSNRLVMAPMTTTAGEEDGSFSDQEIAYLRRRAGAGIGLIITPACYVHKSGHAFERQVGCHHDGLIDSLSRCARAINEAGAASFLQIHHGGNAAKQAFTGRPPLAPSPVKNRRGTSELPQQLSETEIVELIDAFAAAAERAHKAGFTGVEIHGANTYLFQQFFSPYTNRRTDRWGTQTFENRCRFACEVVRAVRARVGHEYPIAYRISPEEEHPDGYTTEEAIKLLLAILPLGVDIVHVSSWEYGKGLYTAESNTHPTKMIRDTLPKEVPVIGVGAIRHPNQALRVLNDGVELVALGQQLLLDADWAEKVRNGREPDIIATVSSREQIDRLELPDRMKDYVARFFLPQ